MEAQIFLSTMAGAPNTGAASVGDMITVLDAALINGFNSLSGLALTRSGTTVTASYTGHGYIAGQLVTIGGATETDYNGIHRVMTVPDANTFTWETATTPTSPATGTITSITTPLGWAKAYTGTNRAAYRAPTGNRRYLDVKDDAGTYTATVRGYDTMSAVGTGTNPFPALASIAADTYRWQRPNPTYPWFLVGDDRRFFMISASSSANYYICGFFGDFPSYKTGDTDNTILVGHYNASDSGTITDSFSKWTCYQSTAPSATYGGFLYRDALALSAVGSQNTVSSFYGANGGTPINSSIGASPFGNSPDAISGAIAWGFCELLERITGANYPRARLPGLVNCLHYIDLSTFGNTMLSGIPTFEFIYLANFGIGGSPNKCLPLSLCDWETVFATGM